MLIIGITGTLGAGKGTIVDFLVREKNFHHFSVRQFLLEQIRRSGLPENRDSMVAVANNLRKEHSPSYIVDCLFDEAAASGKPAIIESIRTPGEVRSLRTKGRFYLFAVDADPRTRFERVTKRKSETDQIDFETFLENESREMTSTDPAKQNLQKCIEMADYRFKNNGSVRVLEEAVDTALENILKENK
jgi:dephospho-CoA kinase